MPRKSQNPNTKKLTDADVIKSNRLQALANPVRLAILQYLAITGESTATECAKSAGVSPTACSYHLRLLAENGLIEEGTSDDGRERPWRISTESTIIFESLSDGSPEGSDQFSLEIAMEERDRAVIGDFMRDHAHQTQEWREAAVVIQDIIAMTPSELKAVGKDILQLITNFRELHGSNHVTNAEQKWVYLSIRAVPWIGAPPIGTSTDSNDAEGR